MSSIVTMYLGSLPHVQDIISSIVTLYLGYLSHLQDIISSIVTMYLGYLPHLQDISFLQVRCHPPSTGQNRPAGDSL